MRFPRSSRRVRLRVWSSSKTYNRSFRNTATSVTALTATASDATTPDVIKTLLDRGVDPSAVGPGGMTALSLAKQRGPTPIVDLLLRAGAKATSPARPAPPAPSPAASPRAAVVRSLPLLQRADVSFLRKTGCVSCHNNSLTAITVALARQRGILAPRDPAYRRGVDFLLKTQLADGSWLVRSRAIAIQPPLDADFPHGKD